jgi:hypothetical protein
MLFYVVVSHTPLWVWVLFAFLLSRGLVALRPREVAPSRALLVPIAFLLWGLDGLVGSRGLGLDLALFVAGFAAGLAAGRALAALTPAPRLTPEGASMIVPGSPLSLALILVAFSVKYVGAAALAIVADPAVHAEIASATALAGGLFAGAFWGRTLTQFRRALDAAGLGAGWPTVVRFVCAPPARGLGAP